MSDAGILIVFTIVYVGMFLGRLPRLQLDRTGVALLGAIVLIATGTMTIEDALSSVNVPTILVLFGLMVVSAQLRLGGFYTKVSHYFADGERSPAALLGLTILMVGVLSAIFSNDIVCLAVPPVIIHVCFRRRLDPIPFLIAIACAANIGSAATLIGNPQNMLIGQTLKLSFLSYSRFAAVPVLIALVTTWVIVRLSIGEDWSLPHHQLGQPDHEENTPELDRWQALKGLLVTSAVLGAFLLTDWPHELVALSGAGILMTSRKLHSRRMLGLVDWQLLVMFVGLFVVNHAFSSTSYPGRIIAIARGTGVDVVEPGWLFPVTVALSGLVSNVPAVMLLLPLSGHALAGPVLAIASTFAGNMIIVGSVANIIVVDAAERHGIRIDWRRHIRVGLPVTVSTLVVAWTWIWLALRFA